MTNAFEIVPSYLIPGAADPTPFDLFIEVIQKIVYAVIPPSLKELAEKSPEDLDAVYAQFSQMLPLVTHSSLDPKMNVLTVTLLCPAQYTQGVGRYLTETISQWLIPGHPAEVVSILSLNFQFKHYKLSNFYVVQGGILINNQEEFESISKNLPNLLAEIRINTLSVYHARYVSSVRGMSPHYKNLMLQENISSLLNQPLPESNPTIYDQMQGVIRKINQEENVNQLQQNLSRLLQAKPDIFDRNVFYEMNNITHLFSNSFGLTRDTKHLGRVIAYQYLFKKIIQNKTEKTTFERHLTVKILRTFLENKRPVLAVLIGMNLVKESERFEIRNLLEAIRTFLPDASYVEDSLIADRRHEKIRFFYLEVEKPNHALFSHEEVKELKTHLPMELTRQVENVADAIFMPRNEEEVMRNLISLSKQLKYVKDLPQVSIHYEKQTDTQLFFTLLVVRLGGSCKASRLYELLKTAPPYLKIDIDDLRIMGYLRKTHAKEAAILRVSIDKGLFFRLDRSVDLLRARQKIATDLQKMLGEFRDFNGGMIFKQEEALKQLKELMGPLSERNSLLLENYFYSLCPGTMPTILEPELLKNHFEILSESLTLGHPVTRSVDHFLLSFFYPVSSNHKEALFQAINQLQIPSHSLAHASLQTEKGLAVGFILKTSTPGIESLFLSAISECESSFAHR